ncbi:MAG: hypothetical protein ACOX6P_11370 [Candidatus Merdivicinus sp.]|jgi:hypothetical protein
MGRAREWRVRGVYMRMPDGSEQDMETMDPRLRERLIAQISEKAMRAAGYRKLTPAEAEEYRREGRVCDRLV